MTTYKELLAQRADLEKQISDARKAETADAIQKAKALISEYGLTAEDVFSTASVKKKASSNAVAPKYRNPATGDTWTGRGKPPLWIRDKEREHFLIPAA